MKALVYQRLLLLFFLVAVSSAAVPANRVIIKFGTIAPEGSAWHDAMLELRQKWLDLSNDQVELRIYAGGVLGGETEMVRKVQRRGLDGIAISGSGLPRIDSSIGCLDIPLLFDSYEELDYVRKRISPDIEKRFEKRGFKILVWAEAGWVYFFTKRPVRTPNDLRQLRLWTTPGFPEYEKIFKEFKFQVVPLPATDMLTSLQTGLIEAIDVPPLFALLDRSYQIATYMTDLKWAPLNAAMVLSLQTWSKIPQDLHPEFLDAVAEVGGRLRQTIRKAENEVLGEMQARGLTVVKLSDAEIGVWRSEVRNAYEKFPCQQKFPELFQKVLRLNKEYRKNNAGLN
jgi:TRAP-type C4-dicarboxylate transport system substrate-binding protein